MAEEAPSSKRSWVVQTEEALRLIFRGSPEPEESPSAKRPRTFDSLEAANQEIERLREVIERLKKKDAIARAFMREYNLVSPLPQT
jgi:hypothetical protein